MRPFIGSEALASGVVNRYQLANQYDAVYRNVYVPKGQVLTAADKAVAAWLWSQRRATVAGLSAAALHGTKWIDAKLPAELNQPHRHKTSGLLLTQAVLEALGWRIIRVGNHLVRYRPSTIVARTRAALRAAGAPV